MSHRGDTVARVPRVTHNWRFHDARKTVRSGPDGFERTPRVFQRETDSTAIVKVAVVDPGADLGTG